LLSLLLSRAHDDQDAPPVKQLVDVSLHATVTAG
jgi:hypothetical protein